MQQHIIRHSQFSGSFYPASAREIITTVGSFFKDLPIQLDCERIKPIMAMLPHAGHIYSGDVTAKTIAEIEFASRVIILCPNHTGQGKNLAVWPHGAWQNPVGQVPLDNDLADSLVAGDSPFVFNEAAHQKEHSIEVILPFLQYSVPILYIVPVSVSSLDHINEAAEILTKLIQEEKELGKEITLLVSSDMNHFANEEENKRKDNLALEAFLARDPAALLEIVKKEKISMCGVLPAVLGLMVANKLGASQSKLAAYDTSASTSNDSSRVVGYAGAYFW